MRWLGSVAVQSLTAKLVTIDTIKIRKEFSIKKKTDDNDNNNDDDDDDDNEKNTDLNFHI